MKNWKTTLAGILLAASTAFQTLVTNHQALTIGNALPVLGTLLLGLLAQDAPASGTEVVTQPSAK